jgi:hypothetical protein
MSNYKRHKEFNHKGSTNQRFDEPSVRRRTKVNMEDENREKMTYILGRIAWMGPARRAIPSGVKIRYLRKSGAVC